MYRCIDCKHYFCSEKCLEDYHIKNSQYFHQVQIYTSHLGWISKSDTYRNHICDCENVSQLEIHCLSLNSLKTYPVSGCPTHLYLFLLHFRYFPGTPLSGMKVLAFDIQYISFFSH